MKTNHPWLTIIHPGPWTQLPHAPAPVPRSASKLRSAWYRPKVPPSNPFQEEEENPPDKPILPKKPDFKEAGGVAVPAAEGVGAVTNTVGASSEPVRDTNQIGISDSDETGNMGCSLLKQTESAAGPHDTLDEAQSHILPRSLSVPAVTSAHCQSSFLPTDLTESDQVTSRQSKV